METHLNIRGALKALNAIRELTREHTVTPEELLRRAAVCRQCPKVGRTRGLSAVGQALTRAAARHKAPTEMRNKICTICGCPLELLLATLPENLHVDSEKEAAVRPETCWIKTL